MSLTEFAAESGSPIHPYDDTADVDTFTTLELDAVVPSLTNRTSFDEKKLEELAASIRSSGVHQAILVRPLPASRLDETSRKLGRSQRETHEIVSGERRWRASKLAGMTTILAVVRRLTDAQALEVQIVENLQREDLTELEEAEGFQRLVDATGAAKDAIGEKIGKSRGYVYGRLKLLDLNSAGREALRRGEIDASKAQLIARIPDDKLQIKALGQATGSDNYGRALSVKDLQDWLQTNVMLSLKRTSFDIRDVTLREGAGACGECPKRTGANPDLFSDVESADLCTDPSCYHDKERAAAERRFEAAQREGKKVIDQDQAAKMVKADSREWLRGHYVLDQYPDYSLEVDGATLRKALGKHCTDPVLAKHPETGDIVEVMPIDRVKRLIKEHGLTRTAKRLARSEQKTTETKAEQKKLPIEKRPEFSDRWQKASVLRAVEFIKRKPTVGTPDLLRAFLIDEGDNDYECAESLKLSLEIDDRDISPRIASTPDEEIPRLFMLYMLHRNADRYSAWSEDQASRHGPRSTLFEILHMTGVDIAEIKAATKRAIESEERIAEAELKARQADALASTDAPKTVKAKGAKKSTAPPAAQKIRAKKPTAQEVQGQIAEAFQALEKGKDQAPDGAGEEEGAAPAAPAPAFNVGDIARVKADSKSAGGKRLKTAGKVGRIAGIGEDGRIHLRHGGRSHELVVLQPDQVEHYKSDPLIWSKVRIVSAGLLEERAKLLWRHGTVTGLREDGWEITLDPKAGEDARVETFGTEELEVLA